MRRITQLINKLIAEYDKSAYNINNGECEDFARTIIERMGGYSNDLTEQATALKYWQRSYPAHIWIVYKGKHYDAECPCGITRWQYLPIFINHRRLYAED